ncbi:alcohol dehydrogenase catalytic domain-containing protein [Rhodococcus opacus]|nr:alcohol dehydrogenase catalytic domain-containing protein [Rhodococcus opacus]
MNWANFRIRRKLAGSAATKGLLTNNCVTHYSCVSEIAPQSHRRAHVRRLVRPRCISGESATAPGGLRTTAALSLRTRPGRSGGLDVIQHRTVQIARCGGTRRKEFDPVSHRSESQIAGAGTGESASNVQHVALITGPGTVELQEVREPEPEGRGVTVAIDLCGVCVAEVKAFHTGAGHGPELCGHEWTGLIVAVGSGVSSVTRGQRVVVGVPDPCGACASCTAGRPELCSFVMTVARGRDAGAAPHGGFSTLVTVPEYRVVPAPSGLTAEEAALVEPSAIAWHAVRRAGIAAGDRVEVLGAGPIGLLVLQFAKVAGASFVAVAERNPARRELAKKLGADEVRAEGGADVGEIEPDVVFECTGASELLQSAVGRARQGGKIIVVGDAVSAEVQPRLWLAKEATVIAAAGYTRAEIIEAMSLIAVGRVEVTPLHTRTIGLASLAGALHTLGGGSTNDVKILVDPRIEETI